MQPIRVQRKRTKGWKMPPNTVYVGRPTKWGNPMPTSESGVSFDGIRYEQATPAVAVKYYSSLMEQVDKNQFKSLRGKNLACWCRLDQPCHADVLLALANPTTNEAKGE